MNYVTYDDTGALTGGYLQQIADEHAGCHIKVDADVRMNWTDYRANGARDGVELLPPPEPLPIDLEALKAASIEKTYADVDAVIVAAVGSRAEEYKEAEAAARAFLQGGDEADVDVSVSSYALYNPTGQVQTNTWAAEQIIQRADAFRGAQKMMRAERFARQAKMRGAETPEELAAVVEGWEAFIAGVRSALGL